MRRSASAFGLHRRRPTRTRVHAKAELRPIGNDGRSADDTPRLEIGEWEVRGDAHATTRFHFRRGITSVAAYAEAFEAHNELETASLAASIERRARAFVEI